MILSTLVNLLQTRTSLHPDRLAYTFLEDGEKPIASLTYRQLDEKARVIATYLQSQLSIGERVLLVYPQGLESIAAFFRLPLRWSRCHSRTCTGSSTDETHFTEIGSDRI